MFKTKSEFENLRHRMQRLLPLDWTLRLILYKDPDRLLPIFSHWIFSCSLLLIYIRKMKENYVNIRISKEKLIYKHF